MSLPPGAHPRSRGENSMPPVTRAAWRGSSPLTRGKPGAGHRGHRNRGLIPTHAGKTMPGCCLMTRTAAHPHSRGENSGIWSHRRDVHGLIPTHAGKTDWPSVCSILHGAHPHSRGENGSLTTRAIQAYGSSPLTRGKLPQFVCAGFSVGLIPTHAGKTRS